MTYDKNKHNFEIKNFEKYRDYIIDTIKKKDIIFSKNMMILLKSDFYKYNYLIADFYKNMLNNNYFQNDIILNKLYEISDIFYNQLIKYENNYKLLIYDIRIKKLNKII